jgi:hypothetical protein
LLLISLASFLTLRREFLSWYDVNCTIYLLIIS